MRKDFYLFRHGETNLNIEHRWQGQGFDIELNERGKKQANELAKKLEGKNIGAIFTSPLKRALMTAEAVSERLDVPLYLDSDFMEGNFGVAEGLVKEEMQELYEEVFNHWMGSEENLDCRFEGGESKREIRLRVVTAFERLLKEDYDVMGVASHGGAIRQFLRHIAAETPDISNVAVFHICYDNGVWSLISSF